MRAPALGSYGLTKAFGDFAAVDDVSAIFGTPTAIHLAITGWMPAFAVPGYGLTRLEGRDV